MADIGKQVAQLKTLVEVFDSLSKWYSGQCFPDPQNYNFLHLVDRLLGMFLQV